MFPFAAIPAAIAAARFANGRRGARRPAPPGDGWAGLVLILRIVLGVAAFGCALAALIDRALVDLVFACLFASTWCPLAFIRLLTNPFGWARFAWGLTWLTSPVRYMSEPWAGALYEAVRAGRREPESLDWVERHLTKPNPTAHVWTLLAYAELQAARGDRNSARATFETVARTWPRIGQAVALRSALRWLQADAAERGDWDRVIELGRTPGLAASEARAFGGAVARLLHRPIAPGRGWFLVSLGTGLPWRRYWPWLRRAWSPPPAPPPRPEPTGSALAVALAWRARATVRPDAATLIACARAWEGVAGDPDLLAAVGRRIGVLEVRATPEGVVGRLVDETLPVLVAGVRTLRAPVVDPPPLLARAVDVVWAERSAVVDRAMAQIARRSDAHEVGPAIEEWARFGALVDGWLAAERVADPERKASLFATHWSVLCTWAARLDNEGLQRRLAHEVFRFECARIPWALQDSRSQLLRKNLRITR